MGMRIPRATYRLQLNRHFTFQDAQTLIDYFSALGISDLYLSPINTAPPESTHGYDLWDYKTINPQLGGRERLECLATAARQRSLGLLVDFVPNHMGIAGEGNRWWRDVLKHGPASQFADCFDIRWQEENGVQKVRLPILGDLRQAVLDRGEIKLEGEELVYFEHRFPLAPGTRREGDVVGTLALQHYQLMHWRHGTEQINYRRFFEVNTLAGVAVERPHVFEQVHQTLLELIRSGTVTGVRLDHIDGLSCPTRYLSDLKRAIGEDFYILVEKILAPHERLPEAWPVRGTTGYDFMTDLAGLWIESGNEGAFTEIYRRVAGEDRGVDALILEAKREVLRTLFYSEFHHLLQRALGLAQSHKLYCDVSPRAIEGALESLIAALPVYRTYAVCGEPLSAADIEVVRVAARKAQENLGPFYAPALSFLTEVWTTGFGGEEGELFRTRLQQLSGPVMAKGVEDTAFYRYHRFVALNEVGGEPGRFGLSPASFHERCRARVEAQPSSMLATSTHDTKLSEDVRARLSVLSELPGQWSQFVDHWFARAGESPLSRNDEYRLIQALVGIWPLEPASISPEWVKRVIAFVRKSLREAKVQTSWLEPNEEWEKAVFDYVRKTCSSPDLRQHIRALVEFIAPFGAMNSLSQTLLKLTAPGVPDIYQGNEIWDFSLVDPDNRRPVDYLLRRKLLAEIDAQSPSALLQDWRSGAIKMKVIRDTLHFRKRHSELFAKGSHEPVEVEGAWKNHCVAFRRRFDGNEVVVAVPRLCTGLGFSPAWGDTRLRISGSWENIFTSERGQAGELATVLRSFPVALLFRTSAS